MSGGALSMPQRLVLVACWMLCFLFLPLARGQASHSSADAVLMKWASQYARVRSAEIVWERPIGTFDQNGGLIEVRWLRETTRFRWPDAFLQTGDMVAAEAKNTTEAALTARRLPSRFGRAIEPGGRAVSLLPLSRVGGREEFVLGSAPQELRTEALRLASNLPVLFALAVLDGDIGIKWTSVEPWRVLGVASQRGHDYGFVITHGDLGWILSEWSSLDRQGRQTSTTTYLAYEFVDSMGAAVPVSWRHTVAPDAIARLGLKISPKPNTDERSPARLVSAVVLDDIPDEQLRLSLGDAVRIEGSTGAILDASGAVLGRLPTAARGRSAPIRWSAVLGSVGVGLLAVGAGLWVFKRFGAK